MNQGTNTEDYRRYLKNLRKLKESIVRRQQTYNFLQECKRWNILPRTFQFQRVIHGIKTKDVLMRTGWILFGRAKRTARHRLYAAKRGLAYYMEEHIYTVFPNDLIRLERNVERLNYRLSKKYSNKVAFLMRQNHRFIPTHQENLFINKSSHSFPETDLQILCQGPDLHVQQPEPKKKTIIADLYNAVGAMVPENQVEAKSKLLGIVALKTKHQLTSTQLRRIKQINKIGRTPNVTFCLGDKTPHIVALDTATYVSRVQDFIQETGCEVLDRDPTNKIKDQIQRLLNKEHTPAFLKNAKPPLYCAAPLLFANVKTHKNGTKIRPVVSRRSHPMKNIETAFLKQFGDYVNEYPYRVGSSLEAIKRLNRIQVDQRCHRFYKFDVVSLFPSTNLSHAVNTFRSMILERNQYSLAEIEIITEILSLYQSSNYFSFRGVIYKQTVGVPMGGSLSGFLAELVLQSMEAVMIPANYNRIVCYMRYVDDVLILWDESEVPLQHDNHPAYKCLISEEHNAEYIRLHTFTDGENNVLTALTDQFAVKSAIEMMNNMSQLREEITFTIEEACKEEVAFLDLSLKIRGDLIDVDIYRKPSFMWNLPHWSSGTSVLHKRATVFPLLVRANTYLSNHISKTKEIKSIFTAALNRGYPMEVLHKWNTKARQVSVRTDLERITKDNVFRRITPSNIDQKILNVLRSYGIIGVSKKQNILWNMIRNNKEKRGLLDRPGVYRIQLQHPNGHRSDYIGRTLVGVNRRIAQHQLDIQRKDPATGLSQAVLLEGYTPMWDQTEIIDRVSTLLRSIILEAHAITNSVYPLVNVQMDYSHLSEWINGCITTR